MNTEIFICHKCGSKNTRVSTSNPLKKNPVENFIDFLGELCRKNHNVIGGQKFIICKDCGSVSSVMVN